MPWKCPHCETEIERLNYNVEVVENEYGTAELADERPTIAPNSTPRGIRNAMITDHDYDECSDSDWNGDPEYTCRECEHEIILTDLIWVEQTEESIREPIITTTTIPPTSDQKQDEMEETTHAIIKPAQPIQRNGSVLADLDCLILCKNCFHVLILNDNYQQVHQNSEYFVDCPECGETTSNKEYIKLAEEGYYNHPEKHDRQET